MKIIYLNTWGGRCGKGLYDWIKTQEVDIYCFQEIFSAPMLNSEERYFVDDDEHTIDLQIFEHLEDILPDYTSFFSAGSKGYINDSQFIDLPVGYGLGFFISNKIDVLEYASGLVYGKFRDNAIGFPPLSRSCQVARIAYLNSEIVIGNIHGLWEPTGKQDTPKREKQALAFGQFIRQVSKKDTPVFIGGDFNLLPDSKTFSLIGDYRNLITEFSICSTRTKLYKKPIKYADYMLASTTVSVKEIDVLQSPVISDHCVLFAEIDF